MAVSNLGGSFTKSIQRELDKTTRALSDVFTKLASGKRINKASDDAAGQAIVASLEADSKQYSQASRNINDGISVASIADGALDQQGQILTRLSELSSQASNGTLSDTQRETLNQEFQSLKSEYERIGASTEFNGQQVFQQGSTSIQVGTDSSADSQIGLGSQLPPPIAGDISTQAGAQSALDSLKQSVSDNAALRGRIGADVSRLETSRNNVEGQRVEAEAAASRIRDVDIAEETAKRTALSIRQNGTSAILGQAGKLNADIVGKLLS